MYVERNVIHVIINCFDNACGCNYINHGVFTKKSLSQFIFTCTKKNITSLHSFVPSWVERWGHLHVFVGGQLFNIVHLSGAIF